MSGRNHPRMKCHIPRMNCPIWLNKSNIQFLRYCGELSTTGVNIQAVANKDLVWNMIALQLAGKSADFLHRSSHHVAGCASSLIQCRDLHQEGFTVESRQPVCVLRGVVD